MTVDLTVDADWMGRHEQVEIRPWTVAGEPVDGAYVERFWLPIMGPSAWVVWRHLARHLHEGHTSVDVNVMGQAVGLPGHASRGARQGRLLFGAIHRLSLFGLLYRDHDVLRVRTTAPPLSFNQVRRLPEPLRSLHEQIVGVAS